MRDIIWTLIIIWLVYKVVAMFKSNTAAKSKPKFNMDPTQEDTSSSRSKGPKPDLTKPLNKEGEYVDYEEIK